ncbi:Methylenetetrahydrofolate reductase [Oceanospirillum linum]|nr:Methylenetetrahydrofolate reductase [Oleiphilus messinensis]SMP33563.1 Methylenetetrahydrofolate reductase [Oceanospirillum linum]
MSQPVDISFEFFPPKTPQGQEKLRVVRDELAAMNPAFFSVTYGAGGSTQERTINTVQEMREAGINTAPHLSCVGSSTESLRELLNFYIEKGIDRIVALRGDLPSGMGSPGELRYANELVEFIRKETGDHFHLEVAAYPETHPQAASFEADLLNFKKTELTARLLSTFLMRTATSTMLSAARSWVSRFRLFRVLCRSRTTAAWHASVMPAVLKSRVGFVSS